MSTGYETGDPQYGEIPRDDNGDFITPFALSDSGPLRDVASRTKVIYGIDAPAGRDYSAVVTMSFDELRALFVVDSASGDPDDSLRCDEVCTPRGSRSSAWSARRDACVPRLQTRRRCLARRGSRDPEYARTWFFDPNFIDNDARKMLRAWGTERLRIALPEPSVDGDPEILRRDPHLLAVYARDRMVTTRAVYLARREDILARCRAPRPVENPVNLDGPARCAWRAPSVGTACETRKMRCRAHSYHRPIMRLCVASTHAICTTGKVTL